MSLNSRREKILFINHSSELGGGELSLFDIARNMPGCEVLLLSAGPLQEKLRAADVPFSIIDAKAVLDIRRSDGFIQMAAIGPSLLVLIAQLARRARGARVLYANSQKAFVAGALASIVARRPLIWHLRDLLTPEHFSGAMRKLTITLANRCADHVIANSSATADAFRAAGGKVPVTVVHSCIDAAQFDAAPATLPASVLSTGPVLGVFSRLAGWKGQHVVIEALAALPKYQLVLVGDALFGEEAYAAQLRDLAQERGVADRVHFLGFRHDSPALMRAIDVVIHSSTSPEPFGRVIVEGMLAGKPVIATAAGGALEIIDNGVNGLLVPPGDAAALVAAIRKLADVPDYARSLAEKGRRHAVTEFGLEAANARVRAIIDSV
jgi:glycosyltransferase involved in cell wall biosynthesis